MKTPRKASGLLHAAAIAIVATSPAAAQEEPLVPPENSAVNQYTEAFPTAGGDKDAHDRNGGNRPPKRVLGESNARKLHEQGPAGRATAKLAAETAPQVEVEDTTVTIRETDEAEVDAAGGSTPPRGGGDSGGGQGRRARQGGGAVSPQVVVAEPEGSSGLSEVISRATGSSATGGGMGIFLPLLILATIAWAFAYLARHRRPSAG